MRTAVLLATALALAGCVSPLRAPPALSAHSLTLELPAPPAAPTDAPLIAVPETAALAPYATSAMVYRRAGGTLHAFTRHRWADRPAPLVHAALRSGLEQDGAVTLIPGAGAPPQWRLLSELLMLEQDFGAQPSVLRLRVRVQVVAVADRQVRAARTLSLERPVPGNDPAGGAAAANALLAELVTQVQALWREARAAHQPRR